MEAIDELRPEIAHIFEAKDERRRRLAALPFPEKVRIVVQMQQMVAPILIARGQKEIVWKLSPDDGSD
jgi:hypothetical protein